MSKKTKEEKTLSNKDILLETIEKEIPERLRSFDIYDIIEKAGLKKVRKTEMQAILLELRKEKVLIHKSGTRWVRAE